MPFEIPLLVILIFILLFISICFSATETAITAASRAKIHQLAKEGNKKAAILKSLQTQMSLVISAILIGNTSLNIISATLATAVLTMLFGNDGIVYLMSSLVMSILIIVFAEVMPKILAVHQPERILFLIANPLKYLFTFFKPVTLSVNWLARKTLRIFAIKIHSEIISHTTVEELRGIIDMHQGPGEEVKDERAMLKSILDLRTVTVGEILVHRQNVVMINADDTPENIIDMVLKSPHTRFPVWKDDSDNIIGIIHTKALFRALKELGGNLKNFDITTACNKPWFVPESSDLLDQLSAFKTRQEHFALVVDEYGSLLGIVTLEDVLEEIVGDISDEHDTKALTMKGMVDGSYIVEGTTTIRDINRQFDWDLPDDDASTIAGLILYKTRDIPQIGQKFEMFGFEFEILNRQRNQITLIRIIPMDKPSQTAESIPNEN